MPTGDLKTFAYTSIKEKLLHCDYEPGSVLNETALCQELKISRTPIREALNRLSQENLIQILPKRAFLSPTSPLRMCGKCTRRGSSWSPSSSGRPAPD